MAFSNEDILKWFCATNPLPETAPDTIETLPTLGHSRYGHNYRTDPVENGTETRHSESVSAESLGFVSPPSTSGGGGYYQRLASLQESMGDGHESPQYNKYNLYGWDEMEEYTPGREPNPSARPGDDDYQVSMINHLYENYNFEENDSPELPITQHKEKVVSTIEANQVTIIQGSTGSGKSTQVPQYILDHYAKTKRHCNILCTQPRRIAATSITKFVTNCRKWPLGSLVGYQIGLDKMVSEDTRLTFVTTGVLLQKLIHMKNMNQYTHIILDEVHERDRDMDFCLLVVRKLLRTNSKHVKVILMSATFESDVFAQYFGVRISGQWEPAPIVVVEGQCYPVTEFYLDDIKDIAQCHSRSEESPRVTEDTIEATCRLIQHFDRIEAQDPNSRRPDFFRGTVLVFLPGLPEISETHDRLVNLRSECKLNVLPLHSSISGTDQQRVFIRPEPGWRKVILATNIAESSITVPDIKYVIDFCLVKELTCDPSTNFPCLRLTWASKASLDQRKGRAGRVASGRCYRLITRNFLYRSIPPFSTPEMQRSPLESTVLQAKLLELGEPRAILGLALQPPNLVDIENAILNLKEVGALTVLQRGVVNPYDGDLTFVGRVLADLPVDVRVGRLLVLGHTFGCLEETLVIGAGLSQKSFFSTPYQNELTGYMSKMSWADYSFSDCVAILNAYKEWFRRKDSGHFRMGGEGEKNWCKRNLIVKNVINEVAELIRELSSRLAKFNIKSVRKLVSRHDEMSQHDLLILKIVICGAFYPNYFRWGVLDEELNQKEMSGHDPTTTVMVCGLPGPHPERYATHLSDLFQDCGSGKCLHFEGHKVFVEFERPRPSRTQPLGFIQPVLDAVYVALKKRQSRRHLALYITDREEKEQKQPKAPPSVDIYGDLKLLELPKWGMHEIVVTEIVDAGHFWAQFADVHTTASLQFLMDSIVKQPLIPLIHNCRPKELEKLPRRYCLAKFSEDQVYYRAMIEDVTDMLTSRSAERRYFAKVVFIDYGNEEWVPVEFLCELLPEHRELPIQAFECFLTGVKPSYTLSQNHCWSTDAIFRFQELCGNKHLIANVYCELKGVLRVLLYDTTGEKDIFINEVLVREGFAMMCDEPRHAKLAQVHAAQEKEALDRMAKQSSSGEGRRDRREVRRLGEGIHTTVQWCATPKQRKKEDDDKEKRGTRIVLRGPDNAYEVKFYAMTAVGSARAAKVEQSSVNSIVVDNEPQDKHERLMVAAHVAVNASGSVTLARNTTLLPNIHGLPHLVCLLFAPTVEMRTDELKRQYTGAICGLGFNPASGESLYPEHDVEITFDSLISQEDLQKINCVRLAMNLAVGSEEAIAEWGEQAVRRIQERARGLIRDLILEPRETVTPVFPSMKGRWNQVAPGDTLVAEQQEDATPPLFALHSGVAISGERIDQQRSTRVLILREKMRDLHRKASTSTRRELIMCELCNVRCGTPRDVLAHLRSKVHQAEEKRLFDDDLQLDLTRQQLEQLNVQL